VGEGVVRRGWEAASTPVPGGSFRCDLLRLLAFWGELGGVFFGGVARDEEGFWLMRT